MMIDALEKRLIVALKSVDAHGDVAPAHVHEAFAAIEATFAKGSKADARPDGKGGYLIVLPHAVLDRLKALRAPGESYSDVILRLAALT